MDLACLAFANSCSRRTPSPCFAEAIACILEHHANSFFGNLRQSPLAQSLSQKHQGPGCGLINLWIWLALHFGNDTRSLVIGVDRFASSSRRNEQCCQPSLIKPLHQLTDTVSAFVSCLSGSRSQKTVLLGRRGALAPVSRHPAAHSSLLLCGAIPVPRVR